MRVARQIHLLALLASTLITTACAWRNASSYAYDVQPSFDLYDDRPPGCPPCFNCNLEDFSCLQFANCSKANGKCACPSGFGGDDCSAPLCGSLADGKDRAPRPDDQSTCECREGWEGINCNVCQTNKACDPLMREGKDGICYREGLLQKENFQMCDITNRKILDQLKEQKPQATFSCNAEREECNFQFWVDQKESFYCALDHCSWSGAAEENRNTTKYLCENIKCKCIPGRMLCGEEGSVDIGDFLEQEVKGPATFSSVSTEGGSSSDGSKFQEPAMDDLISSIFGDRSITLKCHSGECLYKNEVPGYEKPIKKINTPLIAGVIAGCALFVVAVILSVWYLSRRSFRRYGPIRLSSDEEEENAKLLADHKPAALHFENVSYNLNGKHILSSIKGAVRPGELMAIMGASGAGKTTFLDLLARKNKRGVARGEFYVNGEKINNDDFRGVIGFVDQEDTMLPTLTVHETIMDSAMLRLPKDMSLVAKEQKVEDVEKQLGIFHIRDQLIGSEEGSGRGISGGEKRRVGIACELVTSPSILFLDEPTSGLDAFNAYNVVECLVTLVKSYNRTVIFTIHQPRSNIVALFDQLILLARGHTVYSGPFAYCQSYFDSIGYPCPPGFNIADYLVDLTMHAGMVHTPIDVDGFTHQREGLSTRASSAMAVKSLASLSNLSAEQSAPGSSGNSYSRPSNMRRTSVKQQQDKQLFTRKKDRAVSTPGTLNTEDGASILEAAREDRNEQWLRLSRHTGAVPPQVLDDSHQSPPATNDTGTDLDMLINNYNSSSVSENLDRDIRTAVSSATQANGSGVQMNGNSSNSSTKVRGYRKPSYLRQFAIISRRTWRNLYRNPMLMLTHYAISIVLAVFLGFLFYGLTDDIKGFQNRLGLFFFVLALFGFSTLTSLTVFSTERLLFVRERAKGYYSPVPYFAAKVIFDIVPLRLVPPIILGAIVYPMTGLVPAWPEFLKFILFLVLFNFAAATICLFIGIVFRNMGVANLIGSLVMLFSLLFSGFLLNKESMVGAIAWLQYVSRLSSLY